MESQSPAKLVVITGCLGFIGSYVTRACLARQWKVLGVDSQTYAANREFLTEFMQDENFTYLNEDICTLSSLPDCDYVINLAAETHVGNSIISSESFLRTNIIGVQHLLDLIKNKPSNVVSRPTFIHFSTDEVYGDIVEGFHTETDLLKPSNPYAASKAAADMFVLAWARTYGLNYVILRPTNNYGIGQYPEKLIPLSIKLLQRGKKIRLHDKGEPVRTWLNASDTARAAVAVIDNDVRNEIFNISGNCELSNMETVKKVLDGFFGGTLPKNYEDFLDLTYVREGQDVRYAVSSDKLMKLGWKPMANMSQEMPQLVEWYKSRFRW